MNEQEKQNARPQFVFNFNAAVGQMVANVEVMNVRFDKDTCEGRGRAALAAYFSMPQLPPGWAPAWVSPHNPNTALAGSDALATTSVGSHTPGASEFPMCRGGAEIIGKP